MRAAGRTPQFDDPAMNQQAVQPMEESLAHEAAAVGLKRSVGRRGPVQVDRPHVNQLMKRATGRKVKRAKSTPTAFMGDFGGRPQEL